MYITKEEAIDVLEQVSGCGILDEKIESKIDEIIQILHHDIEDDLDLWGAEDEVINLFIAKREDLITPEWEAECQRLYEKYRKKVVTDAE